MMKCEAVQNRLLALPDATRVPDDLRAHLSGCESCRGFLAQLGRLDAILTSLPVPPRSEERKAALLEQVTAAGPIITRVPVYTKGDSTTRLRALLAKADPWRHVAGLAAALLIAVGAWWALSEKTPAEVEVAGLRDEMLAKEVALVSELSKSDSQRRKVELWSGFTGDLRDQVRAVYLYAPGKDMTALAGRFDKAAKGGLLEQARRLDNLPLDQRQAIVDDLVRKMAEAEAEATRLELAAPPQSKAPLKRIAETARTVRTELQAPRPDGGFEP
jgi:hypothetical protein